MTYENLNRERRIDVRANLLRLYDILQAERKALLQGDADEVSRLSIEKEEIANFFVGIAPKEEDPGVAKEIRKLALDVSELVQLNHALLIQMHTQYNGMLELMIRLAGNGSTYGQNGGIKASAIPIGRSDFTA